MEVILIGAGRYGNGLVGKKYANGRYYGAQLTAVADPNIKEISEKPDYNLGQTPAYDTFEKIPVEGFVDPVAEVAVIPVHIFDMYNQILNGGIKKVILPKPVSSNFDEYQEMEELSRRRSATTLVASNWHYSDITKFTKAILDKLKGELIVDEDIKEKFGKELSTIDSGFEIEKAEIEYSKKHEVLTIDPPSQEMPHALQIVQSTGLCDLNGATVEMDEDEQTKSAVGATLISPDVKGGIKIHSDLQKGDKTTLDRERVLKIYLDDEDEEADIICDYDAKFVDLKCTKKPSVSVDISKDGKRTSWKREIDEDNMDKMYESMYDYFRLGKGDALTIEAYEPVVRKISQIQSEWERMI